MTAIGSHPAGMRLTGGVRLVLFSELLVWARRQGVELGLGALLVIAAVGSVLCVLLLPAVGAGIGWLAADTGSKPQRAVGGALIVILIWSVIRVSTALTTSRRLATQRPPDLKVFQALGSHPAQIRSALASVPAAISAAAITSVGFGLLIGSGTPDPLHWITVLTVPPLIGFTEVQLLRRAVGGTGQRSIVVLLLGLLLGWLSAALLVRIPGLSSGHPSDEAVLAALGFATDAAGTSAPWFLAGAAGAGAISLLNARLQRGRHSDRRQVTPSGRPFGRIVRLSVRRGTITAIAAHRRLERVLLTLGALVLGIAIRLALQPWQIGPAAQLGGIGVLSTVAMISATSLSEGLGFRALQPALRWLHDSGLAPRRVITAQLTDFALTVLVPLLPGILGTAILTRSVAVGVAGVAVIGCAVASATLGEILDSTRTSHSDGSGESGIVGGIAAVALQAAMTAPWAWFFLENRVVLGLACGFAAPLLALTVVQILARRRLHP